MRWSMSTSSVLTALALAILAELENQRVVIANQQEAQKQAILQQQKEISLKQQTELENQRVAIANQQEE